MGIQDWQGDLFFFGFFFFFFVVPFCFCHLRFHLKIVLLISQLLEKRKVKVVSTWARCQCWTLTASDSASPTRLTALRRQAGESLSARCSRCACVSMRFSTWSKTHFAARSRPFDARRRERGCASEAGQAPGGAFHKIWSAIAKRHSENGGGRYLVGGNLTIADLKVGGVVATLRSGFFDGSCQPLGSKTLGPSLAQRSPSCIAEINEKATA
jgi:hypothetical protein